MISNFRLSREPLRNGLLVLLFLAPFISACGSSMTSSSSPAPTSTQGMRDIFHEYALNPSQLPGTITAGPDGNLWFIESTIGQEGNLLASKIERLTPTGTLSEFSLPSAHTSANDIIPGPDGNLWFTEGDKIAHITPMGKISEFKLSAPTSAQSLATGPDGNLWFTEQSKIGRMTLTGKVSEFSLPFHQYPTGPNPTKEPAGSAQGEPLAITAGPDGTLWFTEIGTKNGPSKIGVITPQGKTREFTLSHSILGSITRGPDGNLWFTEFQYDKTGTTAGKIGRITTAGKISYFLLPTSSNSPTSITFGTDHTLWFIEVEITLTNPLGTNGKIGHLI